MTEAFYIELHDQLRDLCDSEHGEFAPGDQFLTERQVAERFATTRPTANKALASLVGQGVLEFRRGVGTFVREGPPVVDARPVASLTEMATALGRETSNKVIGFRRTRASRAGTDVCDALRVSTKESLFEIERLRFIDEQPLCRETMYVVVAKCDDLNRADAKGSLIAVWEDYYKYVLGGIDQTISANVADADLAAELEIRRGSAILTVHHTGFLIDNSRLWHGRSDFRADSYQLAGRLGGPSVARPAVGQLLVDADE